jgi:uncharacterized coiled-coil protein SlyX
MTEKKKPTTASQKRAALKAMSMTIKTQLFEALKLADELLQDPDYTDQFGGELALIEHMEQEEFSIFGGEPSLFDMVAAYRANPTKKVWAANKYDIRVMILLTKGEPEDKGPKERHNWVKTAHELEGRVAELEATIAQQNETIAEYQKQLAAKDAELDESKQTIARMEGRLEELEKRLPALA